MSVAVQVTIVVPTGKLAGASLLMSATVQLSEVVGAPRSTPVATHWPVSASTVTAAGQVIEGAWSSVTVTDCWHVAVLPCTSVTVQVTVVVPTGNCAGASLLTSATPQLSEVVGVPREMPVAKQLSESALTLTSAGQVICGSSVSSTVTVCVQVLLLPPLSVTVQVTVVVPTGNSVGASLVTLSTLQLSEVNGVPRSTLAALQLPASALTVASAGHVMAGAVSSAMVTNCVHVAALPWASVTVQMTFVVPVLNTAGASLTMVAMPQLSETVGVPRSMLVAVHCPKSALVTTLAGQRICGGSLSATVTDCWHELLLPWTSVAVQVTVVAPTGNSAGASLVTLATPQLSETLGEPSVMPEAVHASASVFTVTS